MSRTDRERLGLSEGTIVDGRYRIESELGRGGFARVYKASHTDLERGAALKVIELPQQAAAVDMFIERFLREARIAANLSHPNVVTVYDYGVVAETGQPYLAMELLDGWDLEMVLAHHGPMAPPRAMSRMVDVLDALATAQAKGIVHKDLKPSNLFVVNEGTSRERLILIDFGIARIWDDTESRITQTGGFTGTPAYFAPEYVERQIVTPAIDVYQCGLILIEMMTGVPAVVAETSMQYLLKHCAGDVDIPEELQDTPLGAVLAKALAVDHLERYPDCAAFREALEGIDATAIPVPSRHRNGPGIRSNTLENPPQTGDFGESAVSSETLIADVRDALSSEPTALQPPEVPDDVSVTPAPRRWPMVLSLILVVLVMGGGAILGIGRSPEPVAAPQPPAPVLVPAPAPVAVVEQAPEKPPEPPEAAPVEAIPATITTQPPGAAVSVDGVHRGVTPLKLGADFLSDAPREVHLSLPGYQAASQTVVLTDGTELAVTLRKRTTKKPSPTPEPIKKPVKVNVLAP